MRIDSSFQPDDRGIAFIVAPWKQQSQILATGRSSVGLATLHTVRCSYAGRLPWAWWASCSSRNSPCSTIAALAPLARGSLRLHSMAPVTT
jgi:hypothetical protein